MATVVEKQWSVSAVASLDGTILVTDRSGGSDQEAPNLPICCRRVWSAWRWKQVQVLLCLIVMVHFVFFLGVSEVSVVSLRYKRRPTCPDASVGIHMPTPPPSHHRKSHSLGNKWVDNSAFLKLCNEVVTALSDGGTISSFSGTSTLILQSALTHTTHT